MMGFLVSSLAICFAAHFLGLEAFPSMYQGEESGNGVDQQFPDFMDNDTSEVYFNLMVEEGKEIPICVENSSEYLKSVFKSDAQTKFIVHGWLSSENSEAVKGPAEEYFKAQGGNIVKVDWSYDASWKFYPLSAFQVAYIAGVISNFLNKLLSIKAIELQNLHLIGHSLGAHVMGITGSYLNEGRPARITGLDPAKPGFQGVVSESYRLDRTDGEFVDVIHSAAGAAGFVEAIGHVDFYPNGGSPPQPGCFDITAPWQLVGCSHGRAYDYFTESISTPDGFPAVACDSWSNFQSGSCDNNKRTVMGPNTPTSTRGVYYLSTNGRSPYAKGSIH